MPIWPVEETNIKYALPSLGMKWDSDPGMTWDSDPGMTWDSDPTLLTRAPRQGQGPSIKYHCG